MTIKKTTKGITVTVTHMRHGCLEQGGLYGRVLLVTYETLRKWGVDIDNLDDPINEYGTTNADLLAECLRDTDWTGDKIIRTGHVIE